MATDIDKLKRESIKGADPVVIPVPEGLTGQKVLTGLNPEQKGAAGAGAGPVLVLAGPGTGKTRTLISRFGYLAASGVSVDRIMAVTFTQSAAQEMKDRIAGIFGVSVDSFDGAWIGTFHGLAGRILRVPEIAEAAGIRRDFDIVDEGGQKGILSRFSHIWDSSMSDLVTLIGRWKDEMISPAEAMKMAGETARETGEDSLRIENAAAIYADYEKLLRDMNTLDYSDLILRLVRALEGNSALRAATGRRWQHFLVDEYQDVNAAQVRLLKLLSGKGEGPDLDPGNIWAVGDDDQSLYGWRGSNVDFILSFTDHFPGAARHTLIRNYRSAPTILKAAAAVINPLENRFPKQLIPAPAPDGSQKPLQPINILECCNEHEEAQRICRIVYRYLNNGVAASEIAILARTMNVATLVGSYLDKMGIAVKRPSEGDFWKKPEVLAIVGGLRIAHSLKRGIKDPDALRMIGGRGDQARRIFAVAAGMVKSGKSYREIVPAIALAVADHVKATARDPERAAAVHSVAEIASDALETCESFEAMIGIMEKVWSGSSDAGPEKAPGAGMERVTVSTIHGVKGLEFDYVILSAAENGVLPHILSENHDEERKLAFVAVTRARKGLWMSWAHQRGSSVNTMSPYLRDISNALPENLVRHIAPNPGPENQPLDDGSGNSGARGRGKISAKWHLASRQSSTRRSREDQNADIMERFIGAMASRSKVETPENLVDLLMKMGMMDEAKWIYANAGFADFRSGSMVFASSVQVPSWFASRVIPAIAKETKIAWRFSRSKNVSMAKTLKWKDKDAGRPYRTFEEKAQEVHPEVARIASLVNMQGACARGGELREHQEKTPDTTSLPAPAA